MIPITRTFRGLWTIFLLCLLALCLAGMVGQALAQTNVVVDPGTNASPSTGILPIFQQLKPLEFLLIPAVTVLIQLLRKGIPQIPNNVWPFAGPFIGAILDYVATKSGIWTGNMAVGAMLGGLSTWFHQLDKNSVNLLDGMLPPSPKPMPPPDAV